MKHILIKIDVNDNEINSEIRTKGFETSSELQKALEIIGILENLKQIEINKLEKGFEDG